MICLDSVSIGYADEILLSDLSLNISRPGIYGIIGRSGIGKTTLLQCMAAIKPVKLGELTIADKDVRSMTFRQKMDLWRSYVSFHFQADNVMPSESVGYNICLKRFPSGIDLDKCRTVMDEVDLYMPIGKRAGLLSVGQRNRVSIARCFFNAKSVILLDEPLAALDNATAKSIIRLLESHRDTNYIILATHEDCLVDICDSVFDMELYSSMSS